MDIPAPLIVGSVLVAAVALWIFVQIARPRAVPRAAPAFAPTNELERLLVEAEQSPEARREFEGALLSATLLAVESADAPGSPMDLTLSFPPELAERLKVVDPQLPGTTRYGPWIVCFTSPAVVEGLSQTVLAPFVTNLGTVRRFPARAIFAAALERDVDVLVNPFGLTIRYTPDDLRSMLAEGE